MRSASTPDAPGECATSPAAIAERPAGGHRVVEAARCAAAREAAAAESFDLLVSDIELPDGTGLELMRELRGRWRAGVALSGFGSEEDVQLSLGAGFAEHLAKPVDVARLEEAIRRAIQPAEPH